MVRSVTTGILALALAQAVQLKSILIWSENPFTVRIETIEIDNDGEVRILSQERRVVGAPTPLEIVEGARRFVRFSYDAGSPKTYSTDELLGSAKLDLTSVDPGGELLVLLPRSPVMPIGVSADGPRGKTASLNGAGHLSMRGITPGHYQVVLDYPGDIRRRVTPVTIREGRSSVVTLPSEAVGEVRIILAPSYCGLATELRIQSVTHGYDLARPLKSCDMRIGGLEPGHYLLTMRGQTLSIAPRPLLIEPQKAAQIEFADAAVHVSGSVTVNGHPIAGAAVRYSRIDAEGSNSSSRVEAITDTAGRYELVLGKSGLFRYSVSHPSRSLSVRGHKSLVSGANRHDLSLSGGTVYVSLTGVPPRGRVIIRVESEGAGSRGSYMTGWEPGAGSAIFDAIPFGTYKIKATLSGQRSPNPVIRTVTLSPSNPEARLAFDMLAR